jgi:hypothetical protein
MPTFDRFWDEFLNAFERLPVWLPGSAMALGDVGVVSRRGWEKLTTLKKMGIPMAQASMPSQASYSYASGDAVDISSSAGVQAGHDMVPADVTVSMTMAFTRSGAFVVRAENCEHWRIDNLLEVQAAVSSLDMTTADWRSRRWVLVTELVTATPCILIVAKASGAKAVVEMTTQGGIAGLSEIASGQGSLRLASESSLDARILTVTRVPLMWRGQSRRAWPLRGWRDLGEESDFDAVNAENADSTDLVDFLPDAGSVPDSEP